MDPLRWNAVNEIFHAALERPASDREGFVSLASNGDAEIEKDVIRLLKADSEAEGYLETPALPVTPGIDFDVSPIPFNPGDILQNRFRIERHVGQGGMGHVFEAYDLDLKVRVALKVIRPEIASNQTALEYFRREVRMARTITHVNVCRTFDLEREAITPGSPDSQILFFLTMEFLDGETLATRIKREGPLSIADAYSISRQIASGLDSAHAAGVVHRDLKPANIMLVPGTDPNIEQRAVIMDFGLARRDQINPAASSAVSHGALVGTLAYMAPEQLDPGTPVTGVTDVYAFGLILFEMVTGQRAYPATKLLSGIAQRLSGTPPSAKALAPSMPDSWERAIEGCLQSEPGERFQSAGDVIRVLEGQVNVDSHKTRRSAVSSGAAHPPPPWSRRRWRVVAVGVLVCVSLFAVWLRLYQQKRNSKVAPGALVYLAPVRNQTGERALDNLTELLRAVLSQSVQINLLDQSRVEDTLQLMTKSPDTPITAPIAREIAMRTGAVRVVLATVTREPNGFNLNIDIQQPDNTPIRPRDHWERSFPWNGSKAEDLNKNITPELLSAIRTCSDWIRLKVGESANDIARLDVPPQDVTTSDWQALMDYDQAHQLLLKGHKDEAIVLFEDAVRRDSGFARAYADLADNLVSIGRLEDGYQAYLNALNSDSGQRLSRKERDFIKGTFASDSRDYATAIQSFRDYSAYYENDFNGWYYQAYPLEKLDRPRDAIQVLERADSLDPTHRGVGMMSYEFVLLGDFASARHAIEVARSAGHTDQAQFLDGVESLCEGNYLKASKSFAELKAGDDHDFLSLAYLEQTRLLAERGRFAEALAGVINGISALSGVTGTEYQALQWLDRGYLELRTAKASEGLASVAKALDLSAAPDTVLNAGTIVGGSISELSPAERYKAEELLARMERSLPKSDLGVIFALARARVRGELLLARGDIASALMAFRAADKLDAPEAPREYLGRALVAAARIQSDHARANELKNEAFETYAKVALRPATVWVDGWTMPPGFAADQMSAFLELARDLQRTGPEIQSVENRLASLRVSSPPQTVLPRVRSVQ
jgi:serine/threonine protein kinase/tetratricopeptide (TPR) repeat protein